MRTHTAPAALGLLALLAAAATVQGASVFGSMEDALASVDSKPGDAGHYFASRSHAVRRVLKGARCQEVDVKDEDVNMCRAMGTSRSPRMDPFLRVDHFNMSTGTGLGQHPHRGYETLTYVLKGRYRDHDSIGHIGNTEQGGANLLTAGSGVEHSEMAVHDIRDTEVFQVWINIPEKQKMMLPTHHVFKHSDFPYVKLFTHNGNGHAHLISGELLGEIGPAVTVIPTLIALIKVDAHTHVHIPVPRDMDGFVYGVSGKAFFGGDRELRENEVAELVAQGKRVPHHRGRLVRRWNLARIQPSGTVGGDHVGDTDDLVVTTYGSFLKFFLVMGKPINEPVVMRGNFAMTSDEALKRTMDDFKNGELVDKELLMPHQVEL